jgi:hypothetical protein
MNASFIEGSSRILIAGCCIAAVACSLVLGLKDGELSTTDAGDAGIVDDRAIVTVEASTATCDGGDARNIAADSDSVYVLAGGSTIVSACGSKVNPCGTIAVGVEVANANRAKAIYIGPGTYPESLALPSGVTVEGGFTVNDATWTPICDNVTTQLAPNAANVVDVENALNAAVRFLTIVTKSHGDPGESLYAVRIVQSTVTLDNVNVVAELAGPGTAGPVAQGTDSTNTNCTGAGSTGNAGNAGVAGTFADDGFHAGANATTGASGDRGGGGAYVPPACSSNCVSGCTLLPYAMDDAGNTYDDAGDLVTDGATGTCAQATTMVCGVDVQHTCGGLGGVGGGGGTGGAASVALFATGASTNLTIIGGSLASAGGGLGGPGGAGAGGGTGDQPRNGANGSCNSGCNDTCDTPNQPSSMSGATAGAGQNGGGGGQGGGGSGGPTYLIVALDGAKVTSSQAGQWSPPTTGAPGGPPNGPAGAFGAQFPP